MGEFGIYVMTYPGDFHLSIPLIRSIRYFHPDISITIIPGEGFDHEDHPFDVEILPLPDGFWGTVGHQSRDFWAFQGPYERFLYLDADIICTGSLSHLIQRIKKQEGNFLFAHIYREFVDQRTWEAAVNDKNHARHEETIQWVRIALGNPELLKRFDADYDPYARPAFNSGIFASRRGAITEDTLKALHEKEVLFHENVLKQKFTWKSYELFLLGDQGRLNYLVSKLNLVLQDLRPDGHDTWAGHIIEKVTVDSFLKNQLEFKFIHWAGLPRPRPSVFCDPIFQWLQPFIYADLYLQFPHVGKGYGVYKGYRGFPEIPGYALWRYFQVRNRYPMRLKDRLLFSYRDARRLAGSLKRALLRRFLKGKQSGR
jgi:hypothetical protein